MKTKYFLSILFIAAGLSLKAQTKSCCAMAKADDMAQFMADKNFTSTHINPLIYKYEGIGEMIKFATADKKEANAFIIKSKGNSNKILFVYQEWWGLNNHIKKECEKLYTDLKGTVTVMALDLYDGKIAMDKETAGKLMQEVKPERCEDIVKGAILYAGDKAKIASIGWCFGGGWSLKSALLEGKQAVGCIVYYGMPVEEVEKLKTLQCDVLGIFAEKDQWINKEVVGKFETNMKMANKILASKTFPADHAFANPSNPQFDKKSTEEAYALSLNYLEKVFTK